ncbi:MAG: hypothetical protein V1875_01265, partial [Candidatus Altiarchaeota archaeon]
MPERSPASFRDMSGFVYTDGEFQDGKPVMIDTLSFDIWRGGAWAGYRQFCQHFLAPLTLMAKVDARL